MSGGSDRPWHRRATRLTDSKIVLMDEPTAAISVRQWLKVLDLDPAAEGPGHGII